MPGRVDGYYMDLFSPRSEISQELDLPLIPFPGASVYASISLSNVNFETGGSEDGSLAVGFITGASAYNPDGSLRSVDMPLGFEQNSIRIDNCASIVFILQVNRGWSIAQVSVFFL